MIQGVQGSRFKARGWREEVRGSRLRSNTQDHRSSYLIYIIYNIIYYILLLTVSVQYNTIQYNIGRGGEGGEGGDDDDDDNDDDMPPGT